VKNFTKGIIILVSGVLLFFSNAPLSAQVQDLAEEIEQEETEQEEQEEHIEHMEQEEVAQEEPEELYADEQDVEISTEQEQSENIENTLQTVESTDASEAEVQLIYDKLKTILWCFVILFVVLLIMGMTGRVVVYKGWADAVLSFVFSLAALFCCIWSLHVSVDFYLYVGISLYASALIWACMRSIRQNNSIVLGIIVGISKMLIAPVIFLLIGLAYVFAKEQIDSLDKARYWKAYRRSPHKHKDEMRSAQVAGILVTICVWLVTRFVTNKGDMDLDKLISKNK
jgi:cation transport ATPase